MEIRGHRVSSIRLGWWIQGWDERIHEVGDYTVDDLGFVTFRCVDGFRTTLTASRIVMASPPVTERTAL